MIPDQTLEGTYWEDLMEMNLLHRPYKILKFSGFRAYIKSRGFIKVGNVQR